MKIRNILLGLCIMAASAVSAHDFTVTLDGQQLYFDITNKKAKTAAVTYQGSIADKKAPTLKGVIQIPTKVRHKDVVYEVKAIGPKAFANATELRGVVIPSGIESIGDFAFENCDSLSSIVFPGNPVTFGQGAFFNCTSISDITIGSDWKAVDFTMFRWSKRLTSVSIPAKVEKVKGVKKLKYLTNISVDPNNKLFASHDGMLYSKDTSTFYACPRAYKGKVVIKAGVKKVLDGALIDCEGVTAIDFPASVSTVSFRETSRMNGLEYIVMRAEKPIFTGYRAGVGRFFFQLANKKTRIIVLSSSKKLYEQALATEAGEYSATPESVPFMVQKDELPTKKNIKGEKNFNKF